MTNTYWTDILEEGLPMTVYDNIFLLIFFFALIMGVGRDIRIGLITALILQGVYYLILWNMQTEWNVPTAVMTRGVLILVAYVALLSLSVLISYKRGESVIV